MSFKLTCDAIRKQIKDVDDSVVELKEQLDAGSLKIPHDSDYGEMVSNVTLAHRHLEDARMRVGKSIQAFDGGVSCYDKPISASEANQRWRIPSVGQTVICDHSDIGCAPVVGKTYTIGDIKVSWPGVSIDPVYSISLNEIKGSRSFYPLYWFQPHRAE